MDALMRKRRVKYSKRNARIEIPFHVLERLIARDLKLQQIESKQESKTIQSDPPRMEIFYGSPDRLHYTTLTEGKSSLNYIPRSLNGYIPSGFVVYVNDRCYSASFTNLQD